MRISQLPALRWMFWASSTGKVSLFVLQNEAHRSHRDKVHIPPPLQTAGMFPVYMERALPPRELDQTEIPALKETVQR